MKGVGKVVSNAIVSDLMIIIPFRNLRTLPPPVSCKSVQHIQYFCVQHITLLLATCVAPLCWFCLILCCHLRSLRITAGLPYNCVVVIRKKGEASSRKVFEIHMFVALSRVAGNQAAGKRIGFVSVGKRESNYLIPVLLKDRAPLH